MITVNNKIEKFLLEDKQTEKYHEDIVRSANIEYCNNEFVLCEFSVHSNPYSLKDWQFLKEVATFIVDKQIELKKLKTGV